MTKKEYLRAAALLRNQRETLTRAEVVELFVAFFVKDNARFDAKRFRAATKPNRTAWERLSSV